MERKKYVVITAGGTGSRMGASVPKQFLELGGKPILRLTIERFLEAVPGIRVLTVLPQEHVTQWRSFCLKADFTCPQRLVVGGFTRFHSVKNALEYVPDGALVAVHDGVRPLVSSALIRRMFAQAEEVPALIPVLPVTDTLKVLEKASDGALQSTGEAIDRSRAMMHGHKFDLFYLYLGFLGWAILCLLTAGIGFFWLIPYVETAQAAFYEEVKADYALNGGLI